MRTRAIAWSLAAGALALALGCASTSATESHWGDAQRELTTKMIANPLAAQQNLSGPAPLDGPTAEQVMDNYRRGQVEQPKRARTPASLIERGIGAE